jgi:hypothetical protein
MVVTTLEALARVPEEKCAGGHQVPSARGAILERPSDNDRNRNTAVRFLERAVVWARRAHDIRDRPSVAARKLSPNGLTSRAGGSPIGESAIEIACNFPQDPGSEAAYHALKIARMRDAWQSMTRDRRHRKTRSP